MGKKWRNFKGELKLDHYEPHLGNITNILKAKPDFVPEDQWIWLVTYWNSPKGKKRSEKNRKSRELQVMAHTGGSKSFVCYAEGKTIDGVIPSRAMVFLDTHKERKIVPTPMDEKSKQAVEMINEKLNELPSGVEETNGKVAWEGDIYSQVMNVVVGPEKKGQVRGLGRCPKTLAYISSNQEREQLEDDHNICEEKIQFLECELKRVQEKFEQSQKNNAESQAQMKEELKMLKALLLGRRILDENTM